jgi:hypothetical protein
MNSNCPPQALLHAACGVLFAATLVMPPHPRLGILDAQQAYSTMISNAYATKDAAERAAEASFQAWPEYGGIYPVLSKLSDYLPCESLLLNPMYGLLCTEPSVAYPATNPGAVSYSPVVRSGINVGYYIDVCGWDGRRLWELRFWRTTSVSTSALGGENDAARK